MARRKTSTDGLVTTGNHVDKETMKMVKQETAKRNNIKKIASGISVTPPTYYNPLYTPTSLQLPRDRKQINVWSFAPGTPILMADGTYKGVEDIIVGDLVISGNNIIRPVTHTYINHVNKNMVTITAGDNKLSVTHDHICYVVENDKIEAASSCEAADFRKYVTEKYASEIQPSDWMFRAIPIGHSNLKDEKLAYLLGAYLAEGYIYEGQYSFFDSKRQKQRSYTRKKSSVELKYALKEANIVDKVIEYCKYFGFEHNVAKTHNVHRILILSHEFALLCKKHCGRGSKEKILSNDILFAESNVLQSFMNGYIDGDGNQNKTNGIIQFSTSSNNLAAQLKTIVLPRLEIISSDVNYQAGRSLNGGAGYNCNFMRIPKRFAYKFSSCATPIDANKGNLTLANKRRVKLQNGIAFYQVKNIDIQPYIGDVHDITVDEDFNVVASIFAVRQCRHFYNTEAIPAAVIDLYASLPITSFSVECQNPHIKKFMEDMIKRLKLREILQGLALEYFMLGDVFILAELDEDHKTWKRLVILNPDQVEVRRNVLADEPVIEMIPDEDIKRIVYDQQPPELYRYFTTFLPDVIRAVRDGKNIPIDPAHITHMKHMPSPYGVYGTPLLKRIFKTLMYKEMLRRAQFVIAERYVTPLKIFKLGTLDEPPAQEEIDAMQSQLDAVLNDPSLVLVTTARLQADWQGVSGKTLNLAGEYDFTEREMISGLGVSRAFLDGLGPTYANASIGGNAFLQKLENFRQSLKDWVEDKVFKPICELNDFYDTDPDTDEEFLIKVEFKWDALRLQDEASRQQALMQLRQINLVSAKTLLESNHINPETEAVNIEDERDTIFDANRIMARQIAMTQGLQLRLQNQYGLQQMKDQMNLQNGAAGAQMPNMPGVADPTGGGVNVAGGPGAMPPMGGDLLSGFSSNFAPLDSASQRPPVAASFLLRDILKQINAILEDDDA